MIATLLGLQTEGRLYTPVWQSRFLIRFQAQALRSDPMYRPERISFGSTLIRKNLRASQFFLVKSLIQLMKTYFLVWVAQIYFGPHGLLMANQSRLFRQDR